MSFTIPVANSTSSPPYPGGRGASVRLSGGATVIAPTTYKSTDDSGVEWSIPSELCDELLPPLRRIAQGTAQTAGCTVVKTGPHRTVCRLEVPCGVFYVKHFRAKGWKGKLLNLLRSPKAEIESRAAAQISNLGLPTIETVALGVVRQANWTTDSFLVSREIPDALPLDAFVLREFCDENELTDQPDGNAQRVDLRRELAQALGEFCGRMHVAGIDHADFHAANLLLRREGERLRLWLIDLHPVYFRARLTDERRYRNLAYFHQFFVGKSTRADRLRFFQAYQQVWNAGRTHVADSAAVDEASRHEIATLERHLADGAHRGWRRADRAWRRGNRHVKRLESTAVRCRALATLNADWLSELIERPEQIFDGAETTWHKRSIRHQVAQIELPKRSGANVDQAFCKCIQRVGAWRRLLAPFRDSPVRKAWEFGHALLRRGIDTPRPLLYWEDDRPNPPRSYLLTEAVPSTADASSFLRDQWSRVPENLKREWIEGHAEQLARQLARMHESGFDHRDLKFSNLLVSTVLGDLRVWFLDLDGMRHWRGIPRSRAVQNLARVSVSATTHHVGSLSDRLRFLKCYLGASRTADWKHWWRSIDQATIKKLAVNQKRGRPLH